MYFENIRPEDIFRQRGNGMCLLIDLRDREEYQVSHIPEAICIPYEELRQNVPRLRNWTLQCKRRFGHAALILYCDRGNTSIRAARDLYSQGFHVKNVYGGIRAYCGPLVQKNGIDGTEKSR